MRNPESIVWIPAFAGMTKFDIYFLETTLGDLLTAYEDDSGDIVVEILWQCTITEIVGYVPQLYISNYYATVIYVPQYYTYSNPQAHDY